MLRFLLIAFAFLAMPQIASAKGYLVERQFHNWELGCKVPESTDRHNCLVFTFVDYRMGYPTDFIVLEVKNDDKNHLVLQIRLPPGSSFESTLSDDPKKKHIAIFRDRKWGLLYTDNCNENRCMSYLAEDSFPRTRFIVEFKTSEDESLRVEIPLEGFSEAVDALEKRLAAPKPR